MALPTAVRKNADKARRQLAAQSGGQPPSTRAPQAGAGEYLDIDPQTVAPVAGSAAPPVIAPPAQAQAQDDSGFTPHALSDLGKGSDAQLSQRDSANGAADNDRPEFIDPNDWQGRYAALRRARGEQLESLEADNKQLKQTVAQLQAQVKSLTPEPEQQAAKKFELDDSTRAAIGEDQAKVFDQMKDSVESRFAHIEAERAAARAKQTRLFEAALDSMVPRWRDINKDQAWFDWLTLGDPTTKERRQVMLDRMVDEGDADSVAAMFRQFTAGSGQVQQRVDHALAAELDTTTRAGSGLSGEDALVEVWGQSEIADFYEQKSRLQRSGKLRDPATLEKVKVEEARIRKAINEGRVDNSM